MEPDAAAYRTLGLDPGVDAASLEAAYRRLIKRYHPDRAGGDSARAAEINRAYHQIRAARRLPTVRRTGYPVVQPVPRASSRAAGRLLGLALALGAAALAVDSLPVDWPGAGLGEIFRQPVRHSYSSQPAAVAAGVPVRFGEQPLDADAIDRSVLSALRLADSGESLRLTNQSRRCHAELRRAPHLSRFDQCVAFDEAAVVLMQRNQLIDDGQFSSAAVTGRHLGAARLFSEDYLLIESRLDRIRSRVEFNLAPADPQPFPQLEL